MAEQDNINLIQKEYDAFGRGDVETILSNVADAVEWTFEAPASIPFSGRRRNKAEVLGFFQALGGTLDNMSISIEEFIAQGDKVATTGRFKATVKATGRSFDVPMAHRFTIQNGKIVRFVDFHDTATIVEAYRETAAAAR